MPNTWSRGEPLTPYDPELSKPLRKMNNQGVRDNPLIKDPEEQVNNENAQVHGDNLLGDTLKVDPRTVNVGPKLGFDMSTTKGAEIIDGRAIDGAPNVDPVSFGKSDPPVS
uniref:Uncharacterized protein n=1 Tax=Solanum tuberosum TaxID=4113 RepID=M1DEI5_SOLTU